MFYEAIYRPANSEKLSPEARKYINKKIALQEGWRLEDGPFKGQHCFIPSTNFGLIPSSDLKFIKNISFNTWKKLQDLGE